MLLGKGMERKTKNKLTKDKAIILFNDWLHEMENLVRLFYFICILSLVEIITEISIAQRRDRSTVTLCDDVMTTLSELSTWRQICSSLRTSWRDAVFRASSRLTLRWGMFRHSAKSARAGGTNWLPWAQCFHGMRFSSSSIIYPEIKL